MKRMTLSGSLLIVGLGLAACGDDEVAGTADAADAADTVVTTDTSTNDTSPPDTGVATDATSDADVSSDSDDDSADTAAPIDWSARGPYNVGYHTDSVTYAANDGSGDRTLRVVYWYPTRATAGDEVLYAGLLPAPGVLGAAAPVADLGPLPLVVFSHGNTSFAEQSFFFTEFLATHGFVVAAMDHTGNTFGATTTAAVFHWRPADVSAVIDHMEALPAEHLLAGLAGDDIAVTGHSFGGYTTLAVGGATWAVDAVLAFCETGAIPVGGCAALEANQALYRAGFADPRVDALVPMTPGATMVFGATGSEAVMAPTLLMTGALDQTTTNEDEGDPTWAQLAKREGNLRLDFATAGHFTFSDACSLGLGIGVGDGCGDGFIAPAAAHAAINAYALAFLRLHLMGDTSGQPLLGGTVTIEADVTVSRGALP